MTTFDYKRTSKNISLFAFNEKETVVSYVPRKRKVVTLFSELHDQLEIEYTQNDKTPIMILE